MSDHLTHFKIKCFPHTHFIAVQTALFNKNIGWIGIDGVSSFMYRGDDKFQTYIYWFENRDGNDGFASTNRDDVFHEDLCDYIELELVEHDGQITLVERTGTLMTFHDEEDGDDELEVDGFISVTTEGEHCSSTYISVDKIESVASNTTGNLTYIHTQEADLPYIVTDTVEEVMNKIKRSKRTNYGYG